jgi:two-component system cell cycle sensor histidine kinase/response regulator CckA
MKSSLQILIAEDNPADVRLMLRALQQAGFEFTHQIVATEAEYLVHLRPDLDIILSDYEMPQFGGMRALEILRERGLEIPFVIVSGTIGEDLAVAAMKQGAHDYLLKDRLARLGPAVTQAIEQGRARKESRKAEEALRESEERFRQLAENIQEVFWLTDLAQDQMLYVSPAYESIWGRPRAELYGSARRWLDAIHPDDREGFAKSMTSKQEEGIYDEEYRIVRPDGSVRWVRDRAFPVANAAGEWIGSRGWRVTSPNARWRRKRSGFSGLSWISPTTLSKWSILPPGGFWM